jgi:hypothetical protein
MTTMTQSRPLWLRLFFALPIIGWITHDVMFKGQENIWYALLTVVSLWGIAILKFGVPGLYIPAVCMVPVMFIVLILITRG